MRRVEEAGEVGRIWKDVSVTCRNEGELEDSGKKKEVMGRSGGEAWGGMA